MGIVHSPIAKNSNGGTELMANELERRVNSFDPSLLDNFQIFLSRVHEPINKDKIVIIYLHDLAEDPAAAEELKNGRWKRFDFLVFVSNWQLQQYNKLLGVPYSRSIVIENCINVFKPEEIAKEDDKVRLIYTPTPHRGLEILVPVFKKLQEKYGDLIELDVFSSFKLYGWEERDKMFAELFDECRNTSGINYHGAVSNEALRPYVGRSHIFAYPSIWPETSCLCLMEAMSAGLMCVHPNYGALPDTAGGMTAMYQWSENPDDHRARFTAALDNAISVFANYDKLEQFVAPQLMLQKIYADARFNWESRQHLWLNLLSDLLKNKDDLIKNRQPSGDMFSIRTV